MVHNIYDNLAGQPHRGVYHAYCRVSTDTQTLERQQDMIRKSLNGGKHEVKWYSDEDFSGTLPPEQRPGLKKCLDDAFKNKRKGGKGNVIVADISRFSRKVWHSYRFFEDELKKDRCNLIVCDMPHLEMVDTRTKIILLKEEARKAEEYATDIGRKTKQALDAIRSEINDKGFKVSKKGNRMVKLGMHDNMDKARDIASERKTFKADAYAYFFYRDIMYRIGDGYSYRAICEEFNAYPDRFPRPNGGEWNPASITKLIKRVELGSPNNPDNPYYRRNPDVKLRTKKVEGKK